MFHAFVRLNTHNKKQLLPLANSCSSQITPTNLYLGHMYTLSKYAEGNCITLIQDVEESLPGLKIEYRSASKP